MTNKFTVEIPANGALDNKVLSPNNTLTWFIEREGNALIEIIPQRSSVWSWDTVKLATDVPGIYIDLPEVTGFSFANMSGEPVTITVSAMPTGGA